MLKKTPFYVEIIDQELANTPKRHLCDIADLKATPEGRVLFHETITCFNLRLYVPKVSHTKNASNSFATGSAMAIIVHCTIDFNT